MHDKQQYQNSISHKISRVRTTALAMTIVFVLIVILTHSAQAQTFNIIYNFTGRSDGAYPCAGLTTDTAGNLYGTTSGTSTCDAGASSGGTVFRVSKRGSGWVFTLLYAFRGGVDGADPLARVIIGPDGNLYGTTFSEGGNGCGMVFKLLPLSHVPPNVMGGWTETVIYRFTASGDGCGPSGDLIFDQAGNIYGTTVYGGANGQGTVYELAPSPGGWTETVLYSFDGYHGAAPWFSGVILDGIGSLYGTTVYGGGGGCEYGSCGSVFQLTRSGSGWTANVIHDFYGGDDGAQPVGGLVSDPQGYLYGTTAGHGTRGGGTAFEVWQGQGWEFMLHYSFAGGEFEGPFASLVVDAVGNLYGTTYLEGAYRQGSAFELIRGCAGDTYTSLHDFAGGQDGANPISSLVFDANGNIFGTTSSGGAHGYGVVFEITPAPRFQIGGTDAASCR